MSRSRMCFVALCTVAACAGPQTSEESTTVTGPKTVAEEAGLIVLASADEEKRFILRYPQNDKDWNSRLLVAAHGGTGGPSLSADGTQIGTGETSLDDLIGEYAVAQGFAYASVDRNGVGGTPQGLALVNEFAALARGRVADALGRDVELMYLVGLSMGGGIARYASEDPETLFDSVIIVAGAAGDAVTQVDRLARRVALWPKIDPREHPEVKDEDPLVLAYSADGSGTPVEARALWPFIGASSSRANLQQMLASNGLEGLSATELEQFRIASYADRPGFVEQVRARDTSGHVQVPTLEIVGTYDDFVLAEILAYKRKVLSDPAWAAQHRLYQVREAWHISREDDALEGFRYRMSRMGLSAETQRAAGEFGSYVQAVQDALDFADRWVTHDIPAPRDQTVYDGAGLIETSGTDG